MSKRSSAAPLLSRRRRPSRPLRTGLRLGSRLRRALERGVESRLGGYVHRVQGALPGRAERAADPAPKVAVVGGGLAGVAAAQALARRGIAVTLLDRDAGLGGKLRAWTDVRDGEAFPVEHGFHAFFRHYYNLNGFLDSLSLRQKFAALDDYLIVTERGQPLSFREQRAVPGLNIIGLIRQGWFRWSDVLRRPQLMRLRALLAYHPEHTFARFDAMSFAEFARRAHLPDRLKTAFSTFARAFFESPDKLSAAELLRSFHFFFLSHPRGLLYDYPTSDYQQALVGPIRRHLQELGVEVRCGASVQAIVPQPGGFTVRWAPVVGLAGTVEEATGVRGTGLATKAARFDGVVLAADLPGAQAIVNRSPELTAACPRLAACLEGLPVACGYAVWRIWTRRPLSNHWPVFVNFQRRRALDAITFYHRFEPHSRAWAEANGGSVIELHSYAVPAELSRGRPGDEAELKSAMLDDLGHFMHEFRAIRVERDVFQWREDFPGYHVGMDGHRPGVPTELRELALAGDWVKTGLPAMHMEGAFTSGLMAANRLLDRWGVQRVEVLSVAPWGLLAPRQGRDGRAGGGRSSRLRLPSPEQAKHARGPERSQTEVDEDPVVGSALEKSA